MQQNARAGAKAEALMRELDLLRSENESLKIVLAREREKFEGIFHNIPVMITLYDPEQKFFRFNDEFRKVLGWTDEDTATEDLMSKVYPDPAYRREVAEFMRSLSPGWREFKLIAKDGAVVNSEWANVFLDSGLRIGIGIDIRNRKKDEEKIRNNEQRLRGIFNAVAIGILEVDSEDNISSMNDRCCEILGYTRKELLGKNIRDITWPEDRERSEDLNTRLHKGEMDIFDYEKRYIRKDGSPLWVHVTVSAVRNSEGKHVGSVGTIEDISARRMYMEALQESEENLKVRNEELTRFIYTVSHDLKSPLVTIKSFISYLMEDIENNDREAQERDINYIHTAADRMGKLLDELLELSRIGRKEKPKSQARLSTVIHTAMELVAGRLNEKKVKVRITGPDVLLYGHTERFIQLYQNLLDNSAKFMDNQPDPLIEAGALKDEENNEVVLFVRDNGKGIDPRHHHKIFGLFEKMDNNTEGTGIGLALVKRIVEVHGGSVWFTSEGKGKGTAFYFKLKGSHIIN